MKKLLLIPLLLLSLTTMAACSTTDDTPDTPSGNGNMLVLYFSAEGHTQAIAERIVKLTGADIHRIEAAEPYAANPYDDSDRIQHEAYNDLRPGVANLLDKEALAKYDTIFVISIKTVQIHPVNYCGTKICQSLQIKKQFYLDNPHIISEYLAFRQYKADTM